MSVNYNWLSEATEALEFILHVELQKFHITLADLTKLPGISNEAELEKKWTHPH